MNRIINWEALHVLTALSEDAPRPVGAESVATLTPFAVLLANIELPPGAGHRVGKHGQGRVFTGSSRTARLVVVLAPQLCATVHHVVAVWDALARHTVFSDTEAMLAPYLLWSPARGAFLALSRPADGEASFLVPTVLTQVLYHGRPASSGRSINVGGGGSSSGGGSSGGSSGGGDWTLDADAVVRSKLGYRQLRVATR